MGTAKRERQKANRQLRLEELAKQARKEKTKRMGLRVGLGIVAVFAIAGAVYLFSGSDDNTTTSATTSTTLDPTVTTVDPNAPTTTFAPAPPKPTVTPPDGPITELKVTTLSEGTGDVIQAGDTIEVYYDGITASDGVEFQENYTSGTGPISFAVGVGGLIAGWDQGLVGLKAGGQYRLDIPVDLAYGPDAAAGGKPAGDLTFVIDIVSVTHAAPVDTAVTTTS